MNWDPHERGTCGSCRVREGEFHRPGCDMEWCPFCGGQLMSCGCCYEQLGIDNSPGTWTYQHGLTRLQTAQWNALLRAKGLIRFVRAPVLCARCGEPWPHFFHEDDWDEVIPELLKREVLCRPCYEAVKSFVLAAIADGR